MLDKVIAHADAGEAVISSYLGVCVARRADSYVGYSVILPPVTTGTGIIATGSSRGPRASAGSIIRYGKLPVADRRKGMQ
jgi:hypothetical protein